MIYVLYHSKCYDGFGAAYAAWKRLGESAEYIPVSYGAPVPHLPEATRIYIVDFSYPKDILWKLANEVAPVIVIDHHKTAKEDLSELTGSHDNLQAIFDMEKSGALMAWEFFHPGTSTPLLIQHISDRDLWKFKMDGTAKIHKALVSLPMDFQVWDALDVERLKRDGEVCERLYSQLVDSVCNGSYMARISDFIVPIVNTSIAWSEVGAELNRRFPESPFAASFTVFEDQVMWSLRSVGDFDVSEIAKKFGGGGHKNAAGFKTTKI